MIEDAKRRETGQKLIDAAYEFWNACHDEGQGGAVQWLTGTGGELIIFTRGEYRYQLLENIERLIENEKIHYFVEDLENPEDG